MHFLCNNDSVKVKKKKILPTKIFLNKKLQIVTVSTFNICVQDCKIAMYFKTFISGLRL